MAAVEAQSVVGAVLQSKMEIRSEMAVRLLQEHPLRLEAALMLHPTLQPQQEQWQVR
jgi:hypothetical protein